jgi:hypothetical protein
MNQEQTPEDFIAATVVKWLTAIDRSVGDAAIHLSPGQKIDAEKGQLHDIFEIRVIRQMERVKEESPPEENPLVKIP